MSMNLIRWEQQTVTPKHDSIQWDDGRCGALNGCEITHLGANKLRISSGYIVILGRLIEVSQTDVNCNVSTDGELNGQMFIRLDLGSDEPVEIVTEAAAVLTELTQDKNANYDNGIYELLLATYNISETTISNLSVKLPEIDSIGEEISSIEEDISELNNNLSQIYDFSNESVVGTLNGKPIYRKVVIYNGSPAPCSWVVIDTIKDSDIEYLLSIDGGFYSLKYSSYYALPYMYNEYVDFTISQYGLRINNKFGSEISKVLVVLYYTKASS